jgi:NAD(P)-dependent dehydrogenase (short-subunit alcohol dehydrogenase family)
MISVAVITGASPSLGFATAGALAQPGIVPIISARSEASARAAVDQLAAGGLDSDWLLLDIDSGASERAAAGQARRRPPGIDIVINNAGILPEATDTAPREFAGPGLFMRTFQANGARAGPGHRSVLAAAACGDRRAGQRGGNRPAAVGRRQARAVPERAAPGRVCVAEFLTSQGPARRNPQTVLDRWLAARLAGLPAPFAAEVRLWTEGLQGRGPRAGRARQTSTIQGYLRILEAPLAAWSARYESLRQVTTVDVTAELTVLTGATRLLALSAMRSLFGTLRARRILFTNPAVPLTGRQVQPPPVFALRDVHRAGLLGRLPGRPSSTKTQPAPPSRRSSRQTEHRSDTPRHCARTCGYREDPMPCHRPGAGRL